MLRVVCAFFITFVFTSLPAIAMATNQINAVVGDESWYAVHDSSPESASETDRIQTHLLFVADLLETRPEASVSDGTQKTRRWLIQALRRYAEAGVFPQRVVDDYDGRRPRFVDHRGVHCAVGELMRLTGYGADAVNINRRYEHAYVSEIPRPLLQDWALEHGFTLHELAMIQPTYTPTARSVRSRVRSIRSALTLRCLDHYELAPKAVQIRAKMDANLNVEFDLDGNQDNAFATCVLDRIRRQDWSGRPPLKGKIETFETAIEVPIPSLEQIVRSRLKRVSVLADARDCVPRPGAIPKSAKLRVANSKKFLVSVDTTPSNPEVDKCLEERLRRQFSYVRKFSQPLDVSTQIVVPTQFRQLRIETSIISSIRKQCGVPEAGESHTLTANVSAMKDDTVSVTIDDVDPQYRACVERTVRAQVERAFGVQRQTDNGPERYFRIDADIDWVLVFTRPS